MIDKIEDGMISCNENEKFDHFHHSLMSVGSRTTMNTTSGMTVESTIGITAGVDNLWS